MGIIVIKPDSTRDEFVVWCTVDGTPLAVGTARHVRRRLRGLPATPQAIDRAVEIGTSHEHGAGRFGDSLVYAGHRLVACERLGELARHILRGDYDKAYAVCEPVPHHGKRP